MLFRSRLSMLQQVFASFCILTSVIAFFISYLMLYSKSGSFVLPFIIHGWSREQKSGACYKAAMTYLCLAILAFLQPFLRHHRFVQCRYMFWSRCRKNIPKDRLSMLGYSRKGSDGSEEDEEEMEG